MAPARMHTRNRGNSRKGSQCLSCVILGGSARCAGPNSLCFCLQPGLGATARVPSVAGTAYLRGLERQMLAFMRVLVNEPNPQLPLQPRGPRGPQALPRPLCPARWPQVLATCSPHKSAAYPVPGQLRSPGHLLCHPSLCEGLPRCPPLWKGDRALWDAQLHKGHG